MAAVEAGNASDAFLTHLGLDGAKLFTQPW